MTRYATAKASTTEAVNAAADLANFNNKVALLARTAGALVMTADEFLQGLILQTGTPGAFNLTTPTAAAIVAAIPNAQVGSSFHFTFKNAGDGTVTMVAGDAGVTLAGTTAVPTAKSQTYRGVVTAVDTPAVTVVGIGTAAI